MTDVVGLLGLRPLKAQDESEAASPLRDLPFLFDTDVNAPALAEYEMRAVPGRLSTAYITVGTGVGVGLVVNGRTVHGLVHPEAGHLLVKLREGDIFRGSCPFHGDCIEGMCSTGALASRKQIDASALPGLSDEDELWDVCAYYIAQLCVTLVLTASPEHIAIGGGVLNRRVLYGKVRAAVQRLLNGYIQHESLLQPAGLDLFIGPSYWSVRHFLISSSS